MNATATTNQEPGRVKRLAMFVFLGLPGAWLCATFGAGVGAAIAQEEWQWLPTFVLFLLAGTILLIHGTRTSKKLLFVFVFLPMPILTSLGYHLGQFGNPLSFPLGFIGVLTPILLYPICRYYRGRAEKGKGQELSQ